MLFATHYLEEADEYADRVVLMARGASWRTGRTTEIKAMVGTRTIRATLPRRLGCRRSNGCPASRTPSAAATRSSCSAPTPTADPRAARGYPEARDIEITGAGLEEAFLQLTARDRAGAAA